MHLLNRLGQRYLVRNSSGRLVVAAPGFDLKRSASWNIREATAGTFHIGASDGARYLRCSEGVLTLDAMPPSVDELGDWVLRPCAGSADYVHLLDGAEPGRCLQVRIPRGDVGELELILGTVSPVDPATMWRIEEECVADARSIHLRYTTSGPVSLFYNEVYPKDAPPGTFFCTSGFGAAATAQAPSGYGGIQHLVDGKRLAIFSVWHRMAGEVAPVRNALATTVGANRDAYEVEFSGEGVGTSIRLPLPWDLSAQEPVRFVVTAEALGGDTVLTGYAGLASNPWICVGSIVRARTGGRLLNNLYGFVEDFARTGGRDAVSPSQRSPYLRHSAVFANPWVKALASDPAPVTRAKVTAYSPHPLENLSAQYDSASGAFGIRLATGGNYAPQPPSLGREIIDPDPGGRVGPDLGGVIVPVSS